MKLIYDVGKLKRRRNCIDDTQIRNRRIKRTCGIIQKESKGNGEILSSK